MAGFDRDNYFGYVLLHTVGRKLLENHRLPHRNRLYLSAPIPWGEDCRKYDTMFPGGRLEAGIPPG